MPKYRELFIGVDPGQSGGLAVLNKKGQCITAEKMPSTEFETAEWFMTFDDFRVKGMLEKVHAMPGQGVTSMFKFGQNYGFVRGCLFSSGIPFEDVHPKTWQKEFAITPRKSGEAKGLLKERLRAKAQQLFPDLAIWSEPRSLGKQRAICDALLIAEYCRRKFK